MAIGLLFVSAHMDHRFIMVASCVRWRSLYKIMHLLQSLWRLKKNCRPICLFRRTASTQSIRRSVSRSVLQSMVASLVLWQRHTVWHSVVPSCFNGSSQWWNLCLLSGWCCRLRSTTQSLRFSIDCIGWRPPRRESSTNSTSHFSMFSSNSAIVLGPHRRVPRADLEARGRLASRSSSFSVIVITDRPSYTIVELFRSPLNVSNELPHHVKYVPSIRVCCSRHRPFSVCEVTFVAIRHSNRQ